MRFWASAAFSPSGHYVELARAAEAAGFHGLTLGDHLVTPKDPSSPYPYSADGRPGWAPDAPFPDAWVTVGAMSAVTSSLRFASSVYVAPLRELFTVAKAVSTAAVLSGDRVIFGVGAGWSGDEFGLAGQSFADRGRRLDEMLHVLPRLWREDWVEHRGRHFDFDAVQLSPRPSRRVPLWTGGYSHQAFRRATTLCDGWVGVAGDDDRGTRLIAALHEALDRHGRNAATFDIVFSLPGPVTPDVVERWARRGVTDLIVRPWAAPLDPELRGLAAAQIGELDTKLEAVSRFGDEVVRAISPSKSDKDA